MLTILGERRARFCDRVSRRNFLRIGALSLGGLTLPDLLRAEARAGITDSRKAVILIYLPGGISHQDTFDLKMDAPAEIRGEFKPIPTNVDGIQICEHMPRLARIMDKVAIIRSLVGARDEHANPLCLSGYTLAERRLNHPSLGAVLSRVFGPRDPAIPPFVDLIPKTQHQPYSLPAATGWLSPAHAAVKPNEGAADDMVLKGISLQRLTDRRRLLEATDRFRRYVETSPAIAGMDSFTRKAFEILASPKLVEALDHTREPQAIRDRYGTGDLRVQGDAVPAWNHHFLVARRLVEAGARCVTLAYGFWDTHGNNFGYLKKYLPMLDQAISALVEDLHERGLDRDVSVAMLGDFGRTPMINKDAGRDHWPRVSNALLAGGGMRVGQVIGSTDRLGGEADERPVHYRDVFATLYYNVGIDVRTQTVPDITGRPRVLVEGHEPIPELVG